MGMSAVKYRVMPESPDVDLEVLRTNISSKIVEMGGVVSEVVEEPIAFGLKALIFLFAYPEDKDVDQVGNLINGLENVSSSEMTDYRRALG